MLHANAKSTTQSGRVTLTLAAVAGKSYRIRSITVASVGVVIAGPPELTVSPLLDYLGQSFTAHFSPFVAGDPSTAEGSSCIWFDPREPEEKECWLVSVPGQAVTIAYSNDADQGLGDDPQMTVWYELW